MSELSLEVTVVMPCLDEEESVGSCVTEALCALEEAQLTGEVVVVDNGSSDRSAEVAIEAAGSRARILVAGAGEAVLLLPRHGGG